MRYLPLTADDRAQMLAVIGAPSIDARVKSAGAAVPTAMPPT